MSEPFLAEIRLFTGNFAPRGNAMCNGQTLAISQNTALFSLLGTNYGGNGTSTFSLPDLRARLPIGAGQGSGLSNYTLGEQLGSESVTLLTTEMAAHGHSPNALSTPGNQSSPAGTVWAKAGAVRGEKAYASAPGTPAQMNPGAIGPAGGSLPHENRPPNLALNFIIALMGVFPARN